jgi:GGDEF domain-containing protein
LIADTLGHTAGDEVMVQTSRRFEQAANALECVFTRWDAHRFAVLLTDTTQGERAPLQLLRIAQRAV